MRKTKAIAFDLGNVLVRIHPERFLASLGISDLGRQRELKEGLVETVRLYERGTLTTYDCLEKLGELLEFEFEKDAIRHAFAMILGDPIPGMDRLVERAARHHAVALVSNTNPIHIALAETTVPSLASLPIRFLSYEMRTLKPEAAYYEKVVRGLALEPGEIAFVDDRQENIDAAESAGMTGVLFHDPESLNQHLQGLPGIKL